MNDSRRKIGSRDFVLIFALLLIVGALFLPSNVIPGKTAARIHFAKEEMVVMSRALKECAVGHGGLTNLDPELIQETFFSTNSYFVTRTNSQGQAVQIWKVPVNQTNAEGQIFDAWHTLYKIRISMLTNFMIHSAGPDKNFGTRDDIIFNSASNDFVKP